jgi:hypothetical protein
MGNFPKIPFVLLSTHSITSFESGGRGKRHPASAAFYFISTGYTSELEAITGFASGPTVRAEARAHEGIYGIIGAGCALLSQPAP